MRRDPRAFLSDIVDAGEAILQAVDSIDLDVYSKSRLIRSSVEREFILIGEALTQLSQRHPELFRQIEQAAKIVGFRNKIAHEYTKINNQLVWGIIEIELPLLVAQCTHLLRQLDDEPS